MKIILISTMLLTFSFQIMATSKSDTELPKVFMEKFKPIQVYKYGKYYGNIRPKFQTKIFSPIAGTMDALNVRPGQRVKRGQVIGKIKAIDIAEEMRPMPLRSPIDGVISGDLPTLGQYINKHQEIFSIYKVGAYVSTINIAFEDAKALSLGHPVEVSVDNKKYAGKILSVAQQLDQFTGTVETEIEFRPENPTLRPGIISENLLKYDQSKSLALPRKYIHQVGNKKVLYTVETNQSKKNGKKLKAIPIEVEGRFKDLLKIKTQRPLKEISIVTKSTLKHLSEGTDVEVSNNKAKPQAAKEKEAGQ